MSTLKGIVLAAVSTLSSASYAAPEVHPTLGSIEDVLDLINSSSIVDAASVALPLKRFGLLQTDSALCAVKFVSVERKHDAKPPTVFDSGDESVSAEADLYVVARGEKSFVNAKPMDVHLSRQSMVGIGRLAFHRGNSTIKCGKDVLLWSFPTWVALGSGASVSVRIAPTAWTDIAQIDLADARLNWFAYADDRKKTVLRAADLPGEPSR